MNPVIFAAKYLIVVPVLFVVIEALRYDPDERRCLLRRGLIAAILAVVFAKAGGALYFEPRPFVAHHFTPLIPHEPDNAFPSDHTLLAFTCGFLLFGFAPPFLSVMALALAALIAFGRIASGLHSPLDIGASIVMALIANLIASRLITYPTSHKYEATNDETPPMPPANTMP